jgi:hypothetical protein
LERAFFRAAAKISHVERLIIVNGIKRCFFAQSFQSRHKRRRLAASDAALA